MLDLLLAASLLQSTAEGRLKALEERLASLERRQKSLETENAALRKRAVDAQAAREAWARSSAAAWIKRHAAASFSEAQTGELENLWAGWLREAATSEAWTLREAELRARLSPEQRAAVARIAREDQQTSARAWIGALLRSAKIPPERGAAFERIALSRLPATDGMLIFRDGAARIRAAIDASLDAPEAALTEAERAALRETLSGWKK